MWKAKKGQGINMSWLSNLFHRSHKTQKTQAAQPAQKAPTKPEKLENTRVFTEDSKNPAVQGSLLDSSTDQMMNGIGAKLPKMTTATADNIGGNCHEFDTQLAMQQMNLETQLKTAPEDKKAAIEQKLEVIAQQRRLVAFFVATQNNTSISDPATSSYVTKKIEFPNGTVQTNKTNPDGTKTVERKWRDGSITNWTYKDGKITESTITDANGKVIEKKTYN